ncbi:MAG: hypothetical protein V4700_06370, partial [Pseudomonadota bacterium]
ATGAGRSTFNGAFILNSNNTLENIILLPTAATATGDGALANNASNVLITGSQIGSTTNPFNTGVNLESTSQIEINNTEVFAVGNLAAGIAGLGTSHVNIIDSQINVMGDDSFGIYVRGNSIIIANNVMVDVYGPSAFGIFSQDSSQLEITDSQINAAGSGVTAVNSRDSSQLEITDSQINAMGGGGNIDGLLTGENSTMTISGTTVNVMATSGNNGFALHTRNSATIGFDNGDLIVTGGAGSSIEKIEAGSITITNSTCNLNASPLTCP